VDFICIFTKKSEKIMVGYIEKITDAERKMAQSSIELLAEHADELNGSNSNFVEIPVGDSGKVMQIPVKAFDFLKAVLGNMAVGDTTTLMPGIPELNVKQTANFLYFPIERVEELLNNKEISHRQVGAEKLMRLSDILMYQEDFRKRRQEALKEIIVMSEEMGLYDV